MSEKGGAGGDGGSEFAGVRAVGVGAAVLQLCAVLPALQTQERGEQDRDVCHPSGERHPILPFQGLGGVLFLPFYY